jgi:Ran GTPase-activating protein (RanGAP) involved in mRNA processing and transport
MYYSIRKISYDPLEKLGLNNFSTNMIKYLLSFFTLNEIIEFRKVCRNLYRIISNQNIFKEYMNMIKKITSYPKNIPEALFKDNADFICKNGISNFLTEEEKEVLFQNYMHIFLRNRTHLSITDIWKVGENGFYFLSLYLRYLSCTIRTLGLGYNNISEDSSFYLGKALNVNMTLKELHLNGTNLSPEACGMLQQGLAKNQSIEKFEFSYNNSLKTESLSELFKGIKSNKYITTLFLCDNGLRVEGAKCLADLIKFNQKIHTLYIEKNELQDEGIKDIAEALTYNNTLHTINLSDNRITHIGLNDLYECFNNASDGCNTSIRKIFLKMNTFNTSESTQAIGKILRSNRTILELDLSNNAITDQLITPIAEALIINNTLQSFIFESNALGGGGCRILCEGLKRNRTLKNVNLRNNSLGHEGARSLADMLLINRTLETLNLQANLLDEHSVGLIADKLNYNNVIKLIILSNNQLPNIQDILNNLSFAKDIIMY